MFHFKSTPLCSAIAEICAAYNILIDIDENECCKIHPLNYVGVVWQFYELKLNELELYTKVNETLLKSLDIKLELSKFSTGEDSEKRFHICLRGSAEEHNLFKSYLHFYRAGYEPIKRN